MAPKSHQQYVGNDNHRVKPGSDATRIGVDIINEAAEIRAKLLLAAYRLWPSPPDDFATMPSQMEHGLCSRLIFNAVYCCMYS